MKQLLVELNWEWRGIQIKCICEQLKICGWIMSNVINVLENMS